MSDLPEPLVPADVDLSGLDGFLLDVQRLFASELWALSSGDEFKAAVALWGRAWQQTPPGSLPNDERVLAAFSGAGKDWKRVRTMALRGFVECSDGRLYHKVLCDDVLRAHRKRLAFRDRTKNATEARRQRNDRRDEQRDEGRDDQRIVVADEHVTCVQGRRRRSRHISSSLRSDDAHAARAAFESDFWPKYPNKAGRPVALKAWEKLWRETGGDMAPVLYGLERYICDKPADRPWLNPATFLNQRRFEDQPAASTSAASSASTNLTPRIDFGGGVLWPESSVVAAVGRWRDDPTTWPTDRIGPPPGSPGCKVPDELLRMAA